MDRKIFVYSDKYKADLGEHIFPVEKYQLLKKEALRRKILREEDFLNPEPIGEEDILRVHTEKYLKRLKILSMIPLTLQYGENPVSREIINAVKLGCGGTYLACQLALKYDLSMNLTGGFHHAHPDHEEGFCYFNDVAISLKKLFFNKEIEKAMIIDCDVHHGNGNAFIFLNDPKVIIFDIYQEDNYPFPKIEVEYGFSFFSYQEVDDNLYMNALLKIPKIIKEHSPDILIYLASADPYFEDQLGGFRLTKEGLRERDLFILKSALNYKVPICVLLAGGYAPDIKDTVEIHLNTLKLVKELSEGL